MNKKQPLLQLITGVYNNGKRLADFLNCISNQTYENIELIIVDDCSTDKETLKILNDLESKRLNFNKKFRIIKNENNLGILKTFQKGLDLCVADYVSFPECDDYIDKDFYEITLNLMLNKNVDVIEGLMLTELLNEVDNINKPVDTNLVLPDNIKIELDYTHCWYYIFKRLTILKKDSNKPNFINAIKYGAYPDLYTDYYAFKVPLKYSTFYTFYAEANKSYNKKLRNELIIFLESLLIDIKKDKK